MAAFAAFDDAEIIADLKQNVPDGQVLTDDESLAKGSFSSRQTSAES